MIIAGNILICVGLNLLANKIKDSHLHCFFEVLRHVYKCSVTICESSWVSDNQGLDQSSQATSPSMGLLNKVAFTIVLHS